MLCGLFDLGFNTWITQNAYIKRGNYLGGPYSYEPALFHTLPLITLFACQTAVNVFTSAIQVRIFFCFPSYPYMLTEDMAFMGRMERY
jgi:hypothetical protein